MKTRVSSMICGLVFFPLVTFAQSTINGSVKDAHGEPLTGVKVVCENTFLRTFSNVDGSFTFRNVKNGTYLIEVSYAGFESIKDSVKIDGNNITRNYTLQESAQQITEMLVEAIRADEKTPTTFVNIEKEAIEKKNYGQDLPYLMRFMTATVVSSDAGAGVGYTGMRIRGVDPTRTNVTVNGIPLNDSESHGVFWVNMPDFSSSVNNIQVQRGVGTSSNGASAFGASINVKTDGLRKKAYGLIDNSYGSFNTWRHTVAAGTGLINNKFTIDTRLSKISSEGYVNRAASDLKSFYISGAWVGKKSTLRANIFSGKEKTYQAWYGTPESVVNGNEEEIIAYADRNWIFGDERERLLTEGRSYNFYTYENEVDNYQQDHYQLHFSHRFNHVLKLNAAAHYTRGRGYYEQFRKDDDITNYGFDPVVVQGTSETITLTTSDIIRRKWLDNHFYGGVFSLNYNKKGLNVTLGSGANEYLGGHYGEVMWAELASTSSIRDKYYENDATKFEAHAYLKATYKLKKFTLFGDLQYRHIDYSFLGVDDVEGVIAEVDQEIQFDFFNPKVGLMMDIDNKNNLYLSFAVANREPVRSDFRESISKNRPEAEQLLNTELGYRYNSAKLLFKANVYHMYYQNQLVLTGQINDVGGYTRTNVDQSYRMGIELEAGYKLLKSLSITANAAISQNKIIAFNEYIFNYDTFEEDVIAHTNTDLAFSPNFIGSIGLVYTPIKGLEATLLGKYVSDQYLDNTSASNRKIDAYMISNFNLSYTIENLFFKEITIGLLVNNLFNNYYQNNGYTWGYIAGGERTDENFYYPQAGRNFLGRITLKL